MPRDLSIVERCGDYGLRFVEVAGWRSRGSATFAPRGSVNHHTAGSAHGTCPSLNGVIHGHPGSAPGPLANALQSREADGRDIIYIVAAGRANHAGRGGWRGLKGNSTVVGLEIEHVGTEPLPVHRQRIAARFHAAMADGRWQTPMTCQHREWAPGRKIDAATRVDPNAFRTYMAEALGHRPPPVPKPPPAATFLEGEMFGLLVNDAGKKVYRVWDNGVFKDVTAETYLKLAAWAKMPHYEGTNGQGITAAEYVELRDDLAR